MKQTCSCGLPPFWEVFTKFSNNSLNVESKALTHIFNTSFPSFRPYSMFGMLSNSRASLTFSSQSPCGMRLLMFSGADPASLTMTDHHTIGVMPVDKRTRQQKPSRTWFQSCKCLVVRYLRSCGQESKRKLRNLYIYASSYTYASSLYIRDTALRVKVTESLDHLVQWYYKSLIINYLSVDKKWTRRGFRS